MSEQPHDLETILQAVRDAFPDPGFDPSWKNLCTHHGCGECQEIESFVHANPRWREWTAVDCFGMNATPLMRESFEYFLPAYICATYLDRGEADVAIESSAWNFLQYPPKDRANKELFARYDRVQQDVILDWLRYFSETCSIDEKQRDGYLRQVEQLATSRFR